MLRSGVYRLDWRKKYCCRARVWGIGYRLGSPQKEARSNPCQKAVVNEPHLFHSASCRRLTQSDGHFPYDVSHTSGYYFDSGFRVVTGDCEGLEYQMGDGGVDPSCTWFPRTGYIMASRESY